MKSGIVNLAGTAGGVLVFKDEEEDEDTPDIGLTSVLLFSFSFSDLR